MEIVIGRRSAYFCNLKVFLIFLVVYGHLIETHIWDNEFLMWQYRLIYSVHMPLFSFLSGVFLKGKKACFMQTKKAFLYYLIFQLFYIVIVKIIQGDTLTFCEPYWYLWYLLSLSCWALICLVLELFEKNLQGILKKIILLIVSIGIACAVGNVDEIDRTFSLSRTIVFLPYVLMGKYFPLETEIKKFRMAGIFAGGISIALTIGLANRIPISFLYQADSYKVSGVENGNMLRLMCFFVGAGLGMFILMFIPQKRLPISKVGTNTLWIYILHAPLVLLFQRVKFWENGFIYVALLMAVNIVLLLYKGFQWREKLYRII